MTSRRDWQLQHLGITQWALRRPTALQGDIAVALSGQTRLVIVASEPPVLDDPLVQDVIRSLGLAGDQVQLLTPDQLAMLPAGSRCNSWRIAIDQPLSLAGAQLDSPALDELQQSGAARRALWQQICKYELDFYPQRG
ncbi:DNA polymerase III subunit psi [Shimwellia pseudoproteus]|uniref:DNA polymerase III subunit psi n=1 Tax=Shimwellia pseudoproteus TaxID=570012 RepID=UPI0018EAF87E|nr:DNA polymerase III subunit psi [Shimwellia pseudoproteus]MBJ3813551.1 DNA polymerase III subunit psi [Shimwellia pseudoproteus]